MLLIDIVEIHLNVVAPGSADGVFPMSHRQPGAVLKGNVPPDFRLLLEAE